MSPNYTPAELEERDNIAVHLTTAPFQRPEPLAVDAALLAAIPGRPLHGLDLQFPDFAPSPKPSPHSPPPAAPLPHADVVVITYTQAEAAALSDVLTPGVDWTDWYAYSHDYDARYRAQVGPKGPSLKNGRLGSFFLTGVAGKTVLVMKSELHLATDKKPLPDGQTSLPIRAFFKQIIEESTPAVFITTGTAGGVSCANHLGDVAVTRAGLFHCQKDFANAPFNHQTYKSDWKIPTAQQAAATKLMQGFAAKLDGAGTPPNAQCGCGGPGFPTAILCDGSAAPPFFPVITTDMFEFGTSTNGLDKEGMAIEMDDAVLGLVCQEDVQKPPHWLSVRNLSDPCINGKLGNKDQINCAVFYYQKYGYWTTVMSALTCWSIIAGL